MKSKMQLQQPGCGCCENKCHVEPPEAVSAVAGKKEISVALAGQLDEGLKLPLRKTWENAEVAADMG